jgi:hypothetical protein
LGDIYNAGVVVQVLLVELGDAGDPLGLEQLPQFFAFGDEVGGEQVDILIGGVGRLSEELLQFAILDGWFGLDDEPVGGDGGPGVGVGGLGLQDVHNELFVNTGWLSYMISKGKTRLKVGVPEDPRNHLY